MLKRLLSALAAFSIIAAPVPTWAAADIDAPMASFGGIDSQPVLDRENYSGSVNVERTQLLLGVTNTSAVAAAYTPKYVHLSENTTYGTTSALTSSGTGVAGGDAGATAATSHLTVSFRVKGTATSAGANSINRWLNTDIFSNQGSGATYNSEGVPGLDISFDNAGGNYGTFRFNLGDSLATAANANGAHSCNTSGFPAVPNGVETAVVISADTSGAGSVNKNTAIYVNSGSGWTKVAGGCSYGVTAAMLIAVSNANGWNANKGVASGIASAVLDLTDFVADFTNSVVDGSNNISSANLHKVALDDGTPVVLPANCALWGSTPQICLNAPASTWATNKGTATGLTLNSTPIYDAAVQWPALKPAHQVIRDWSYGEPVSSGTSVATSTGANPVPKQNELILAGLVLKDTSNGTGNHNPTCPAGFTTPTFAIGSNPSWDNGSNNNPTDVLLCWKVAGVSETGAYTFNWTTATTNTGNWFMSVYTGANTSTPIDAAGIQKNGSTSNSTSDTAPSLTTLAVSNDTLVNIFASYVAGVMALPATTRESLINGTSNTAFNIKVGDEVLASNAATGTRTSTMPSGTGQALSVALIPN
jgi:hypothetical protein